MFKNIIITASFFLSLPSCDTTSHRSEANFILPEYHRIPDSFVGFLELFEHDLFTGIEDQWIWDYHYLAI